MSGEAETLASPTALLDAEHRRTLRRSLVVATGLCAAGWPLVPAWAQAGMPPPGWSTAAFQAKTVPDLTRALQIATPVASREVTLGAPDIADNGAQVPITIACARPDVRRLLLLVENNPAILSAQFELDPLVEPSINLRIKMGQSSEVYAVAVTADGRVLYAVKDVKVTIGGCAS
jgi:sulfur-oxidizing protein SoxY